MRLIDADALEKRFASYENGCVSECACCRNHRDVEWGKCDCGLITEAPTIGGWISVEDKLPEESGYVLVYNGHSSVVSFSKQWEAFNHFDLLGKPDKTAYVMTDVTHWMPLPEPPKEEDG